MNTLEFYLPTIFLQSFRLSKNLHNDRRLLAARYISFNLELTGLFLKFHIVGKGFPKNFSTRPPKSLGGTIYSGCKPLVASNISWRTLSATRSRG